MADAPPASLLGLPDSCLLQVLAATGDAAAVGAAARSCRTLAARARDESTVWAGLYDRRWPAAAGGLLERHCPQLPVAAAAAQPKPQQSAGLAAPEPEPLRDGPARQLGEPAALPGVPRAVDSMRKLIAGGFRGAPSPAIGVQEQYRLRHMAAALPPATAQGQWVAAAVASGWTAADLGRWLAGLRCPTPPRLPTPSPNTHARYHACHRITQQPTPSRHCNDLAAPSALLVNAGCVRVSSSSRASALTAQTGT